MERNELQRTKGIGMFLVGLSILIAMGTYLLGVKDNTILIIIEGLLFLIGLYYFVKAEFIRSKKT